MNSPRFTALLARLTLVLLVLGVSGLPGNAQPLGNWNNAPQIPAFNQFSNPAFGNGFVPFNNGFPSPQASIFLQQQYNRQLFNQYGYVNRYTTLNNPYWYFSPVVSQYGYYGNAWGTFPVSPFYNPIPYSFVPGTFGAYLQNNAINPFGFPVNNPFARQGPYGGGIGAGLPVNPQNKGQLDPANVFK